MKKKFNNNYCVCRVCGEGNVTKHEILNLKTFFLLLKKY